MTFPDFSIPKVIFHDFPDLETSNFKFHDFPDFSRIYTNPVYIYIFITENEWNTVKKAMCTYCSGWWQCNDLWNAARLTSHHLQHLSRHLRRCGSTKSSCGSTLSCLLRHCQANCRHRGSRGGSWQPCWCLLKAGKQCGTSYTSSANLSYK